MGKINLHSLLCMGHEVKAPLRFLNPTMTVKLSPPHRCTRQQHRCIFCLIRVPAEAKELWMGKNNFIFDSYSFVFRRQGEDSFWGLNLFTMVLEKTPWEKTSGASTHQTNKGCSIITWVHNINTVTQSILQRTRCYSLTVSTEDAQILTLLEALFHLKMKG